MRSWLCFPGCLSLSGPSRVTGIMGGSLRVVCRYQEGFRDDNKFWCTPPCLWKTVETRESERELRRGHGSIRDRPVSLTFKVTLESLREEDAGRYRCGIDVPFSTDPAFQVEVSVTPVPGWGTEIPKAVRCSSPQKRHSSVTIDSGKETSGCLSLRGPVSVCGRESESVSVQCHYDSGWETHKKWWCRGAQWASCRILVQTQGSEREESGARVSITDDQRNHSFTVTMQELRQDDTDTYWCGIENPGANLRTQIKVTVAPREAALTIVGSQVSRTTTSHLAASSRPHSRTHYVLLVFLKVPFLLGLVGAVLWLEERQRDPAAQWEEPIYANLSSELLTKDAPI
ncbi:hypothetical protein MJG53_015674 [Ovis ammon polii x Ovis aries]|uniref:Uncharacterized protein n=1 Tax=Ovis ammon polii x Ovis aries TaxID=2918886 RepID=A0ACB9UFV7_9CETA|nr:hypothetical protein MJG53_015674 [Ovis ammon polii x Ovis aries]